MVLARQAKLDGLWFVARKFETITRALDIGGDSEPQNEPLELRSRQEQRLILISVYLTIYVLLNKTQPEWL
jgi:hypothetical protein